MSKHIHNLKPGESLEIKGPMGKYDWEQGRRKNVGMIAGGTGITPMVSKQNLRGGLAQKKKMNKQLTRVWLASSDSEDF